MANTDLTATAYVCGQCFALTLMTQPQQTGKGTTCAQCRSALGAALDGIVTLAFKPNPAADKETKSGNDKPKIDASTVKEKAPPARET